MKNKKKILMPIMALVLSVILFGYQVTNIKAEEPEVIPNVYNPGSIIIETEPYKYDGYISLEDYTFITTNSANYFLDDILIELKDPIYSEPNEHDIIKMYDYTFLFMDKEFTVQLLEEEIDEDTSYYIQFNFPEEDIINIKFQHAVLSEELPTTVEFTIAPNGDMIDGEMPVTFHPVGEQPSLELIASNVGNITNGSLVIEDYQSSNNYTESFESTTIIPVLDFISFTGSDSAIGLKIGLDGNGFLYHYASISEGAYITLSFDIVLNNTTNYVDITYMLGDVVIETKKQKKDDIPNLPITEPTKYGFIFKGWYLDPEFTTAITLETRFTTNTTVYGYFQEKLISVKYYDGESIIYQGMQYAAESLLKPSNPVKSGHVFMGWYLDPEFTTKLENDDTFESDVNIYAKFIAESGGVVIPPEETEENNKTLYLVGAAALLLVLGMAIKINKPTKKKGK